MRRRTGVPIGLVLGTVLTATSVWAQPSEDWPGLLRERLAAPEGLGALMAGGERLLAPDIVAGFYAARGYEPAWAKGLDSARLGELATAIRMAERHGLEPADYHLAALERLTALRSVGGAGAAELADLELLASDGFVALGMHLLRGRAAPSDVDPEWLSGRRSADLRAVLAAAVLRGRVAEGLYALAPRDPRYAWLVAAAAPLRAAAETGGWPHLPKGPVLELGAQSRGVALLRARLAASGDLVTGEPGAADVFDAGLDWAVRRFQARHGLVVDGVVGRATLAALNVSAEERVHQVDVNLERWRWLPADLGARHIEVNVPAYELRVVEAGAEVRRHRVVVGRQDRETPMVSGLLTHVVLSPRWGVPVSIAGRDLLPSILADPGLLERQRFVLIDRASGAPVDPASVDWREVSDSAAFNARYRLRQEPGPVNALGSVKFAFSNGHSIYLHDTPARHLFERPERDFSSGCVRVENAVDLAVYVLSDSPEWPRSRVEAAAASGTEVAVALKREIPVHLMYWTAWVDEDGTLEFRDDVYERDETVRRALLAPPRCS